MNSTDCRRICYLNSPTSYTFSLERQGFNRKILNVLMELSSVLPFCYKVTAYTGTNLSSHKSIWMDLSGTPTLRVYICLSWWPCRYQNDTKKITSNTKPDKERSWTYLRKQLNTPWLLWPPVIRESRWIMQHSELLCKSASAPGKQIIARLQCNLHFTKTGWTWYIITLQLQGARKTRNLFR